MLTMPLVILFFAAIWAGCQNALAGGGSFITLPMLMFTGMNALSANITSSVALFPSQALTGVHGWKNSSGVAGLSRGWLVGISLVGGALGAALLLLTPSSIFAHMVPWLVLFATIMFAWGSFGPRRADGGARLKTGGAAAAQFCIAVYGGYFGGAMGIMMLAAYALFGLGSIHTANALKTLMAGALNAIAVVCFVFAGKVDWVPAVIMLASAVAGGYLGARVARVMNPDHIRLVVIAIGVTMTVVFFVRG